ncbi:MAG: carbonic anhydrase family protein [Bdellovibrionales bacterium]|nr:carbonic anhydrase family protein [Bdellovibrionales bacterium]
MRIQHWILLICTIQLISGCRSSKKKSEEATPPSAESEASKETMTPTADAEAVPQAVDTPVHANPYETHWGYGDEDGPAKWSNLKEEYSLCEKGKLQSPINLKWSKPQANTRSIEFDYKDAPLQVVDNGHTVQVLFPEGSYAYFGGKKYELVQMHFHSSSEHTLSGNQLPMEAHIVHKNELGQLAVIGVFLIEGRFNPFIDKVWSHIPEVKNSERLVPQLMINAKDIIPDRLTYYFYVGSLTTPPCTEGVRWQMLNTPVEVSRDQIVTFRKLYSNNARPVQPINNRNVVNY